MGARVEVSRGANMGTAKRAVGWVAIGPCCWERRGAAVE